VGRKIGEVRGGGGEDGGERGREEVEILQIELNANRTF